MVAWVPVARTAVRVAPVALEVARQLDRQLRPHVLAYRFARSVDGWVARWSSSEGGHWVVFTRPEGGLLRAFPPLPPGEAEVAERELDRSILRHHDRLPEARVRDTAARLAARGRSDRTFGGPEPIDVEVIEVERDDPPR